MCARGGGRLSALNAGRAVRSIGRGGSQREPRHGCVSIERSRLDSHLQSSFHGAPCASLTTFVVLRRISATHPPILAIIQPYRLLCAQTNTNPSAFSSLSRGTALHEPTGLTPPIKLPRCALRVANHFRCAATHLSDATAHPSHHSAVPLTLRANQRKPWCLLQPLARHGPQ